MDKWFRKVLALIRAAVLLVLFMSPAVFAVDGDINKDGLVGWYDLDLMSQQWLASGTADLDASGTVDIVDFSVLAENWLNSDNIPIDPNLAAYWKFDEGIGNIAVDSSGNGNDGTITGAGWITGVLGGALSFDSNDSVFVPDIPGIEFSTGSFTIALWVKITGGANEKCRILQNGTEGTAQEPGIGRRYQLYYSTTDGQFYFNIDGNSDGDKSRIEFSKNDVATGQWLHLAAVRDRSLNKMLVYLDGMLKAVAWEHTGNIASPGEGLFIGNGPVGTGVFEGLAGSIDDVRLYNHALTDSEIGKLATLGRGASVPQPVNRQQGTGTSVSLRWTAGSGAGQHDVYLGTNYSAVKNDNTGGTTYKTRQTGTVYIASGLSNNTVYYWRIDEVTDTGTVRGIIWTFYTGEGAPNPQFVINHTEADLRHGLWLACFTGGGTVTFGAASNIYVSDRIYLYGDNISLDGKGSTAVYTGPDGCNQGEGQDHFIEIHGDDNLIKNFTLTGQQGGLYSSGFPDGIHVQNGYRNIIENITYPNICEDAVTNNGGGYQAWDTIIRNCYFHNSVDKAIMINAGGSCTIENCELSGCRQPIRPSSTNEVFGFYTIRNCWIHASDLGSKISPKNCLSLGAGSNLVENCILEESSNSGVELWNQGNTYVEALFRNNYFNNNGSEGAIRYYPRNCIMNSRLEYNEFHKGSGSNTGIKIVDNSGTLNVDLGGGQVPLQLDPDPNNPPIGAGLNILEGFSTCLDTDLAMVSAKNNQWNYTTCDAVMLNDVGGSKNADVCPLAAAGTAGNNAPVGLQVPDYTKPIPDPMSFASSPAATGPYSITMSATTATDPSGVEYYFEETSGNPGGSDSGWQDNPTYTDTGLQPQTQYSYKVKARDKSSYYNETGFSGILYATTNQLITDTTPPVPNPLTWAGPLQVNGTTITMTSATAVDANSPPVSYYFECRNDATKSSGWQSSTTYTASGLTAGTLYTFRVKAKDNASPANETGWSPDTSATAQFPPLFTEGFEGTLSGWSGNGSYDVVTTEYYGGTHSMQLQKDAHIRRTISTSGKTGIHVKYARKTKALASGKYLYIEWSPNGSDPWTILESTADTVWVYKDMACGSGADNKSGFAIRFRGGGSLNTEYAYIDNIEVATVP